MTFSKPIAIAALTVISFPKLALAHEDHCNAVAASVADAGFDSEVVVTCTDSYAILTSDTYPDHDMMTGIVGTNEQVPVPAEYGAPVILDPVLTDTPLTRDAALGVAVNGVPIYDYTGGGKMSQADLTHHQTEHDTIITQQLDVCGGHAGRGDDYHYHAAPVCMIEQMANAGDAAIIGWAFDGFPIYGSANPDGTVIADGTLDVCNGQPDDTFGYRYHTAPDAPYIVQCLMGEVPTLMRCHVYARCQLPVAAVPSLVAHRAVGLKTLCSRKTMMALAAWIISMKVRRISSAMNQRMRMGVLRSQRKQSPTTVS